MRQGARWEGPQEPARRLCPKQQPATQYVACGAAAGWMCAAHAPRSAAHLLRYAVSRVLCSGRGEAGRRPGLQSGRRWQARCRCRCRCRARHAAAWQERGRRRCCRCRPEPCCAASQRLPCSPAWHGWCGCWAVGGSTRRCSASRLPFNVIGSGGANEPRRCGQGGGAWQLPAAASRLTTATRALDLM